MKPYRVGIYARLSRDDERQGESVSIENQKLMLQRYCDQQGWEVEEIYVDDGWSGTNFARPGFGRLMEAVREKRIDLVLVKDLSRLGRDYIEVGKYTDCVFPYYGCRFIALNDGVDTLRQNDDVAMIFKNVINDIYARDTSKKIRAVRRANAESGKFMGYKAPYGYLRSPEDKHHLVVDTTAAEVVQKIFALRKEGNGIQAIADVLNEDHIPPPKDYAAGASGHAWCRETVRFILGNEVYIGNLVQLKQGSLSYKDRRQRQKPPETWVRVAKTHEAIIDRDTWAAVRALDKTRYQARRGKSESLFGGLLFCAECGCAMRRVVNHKCRGDEERTYTYYICRGHVCISEAALKELMSWEVRAHLEQLAPNIEELDREIQREAAKRQAASSREQIRQKEKMRRRIEELEGLIARLYEDRMNERISMDAYECLMARYEGEMKEKRREVEELEAPVSLMDIEGIKKIEVSRELLQTILEKVLIARKDGKRQSVDIRYRFQGAVLL